MTIKIIAERQRQPAGKAGGRGAALHRRPARRAEADRLRVWERKTGTGRNVTFPARQYSVNGERRSLRAAAADRRQHGAEPAARSDPGGVRGVRGARGRRELVDRRSATGSTGRSFAFSFCALRRQRPLLAQPLVELGAEERRLHAAVDDVPRQHGVAGCGRGRCRSRRRRRPRRRRRASCRRCARPPRSPARRGGRRATAAPGSTSAAPT